jgi:hypothetical protein
MAKDKTLMTSLWPTKQKYALLEIGHPKHFDEAVTSPHKSFRYMVALEGNDEHRKKLLDDPDWLVRTVARKRLKNKAYDGNSDELDKDLDKYYEMRIPIADKSDH